MQYNTTIDRCECGETKLLSAMFRTDIPCYHQLSIGKEFPTCPHITLDLENNYKSLKIDYEIRERVVVETPKNLENLFTEKAVTEIRKRSKCKNKTQIMQSINPIEIESETHFAIGKPANFYTEVSKGIHSFHEIKKSGSKESQSTSSCDETT